MHAAQRCDEVSFPTRKSFWFQSYIWNPGILSGLEFGNPLWFGIRESFLVSEVFWIGRVGRDARGTALR